MVINNKKSLTQDEKEQQIISFVENARFSFGLSSWTISVVFEHLHKDTVAHIVPNSNYLSAKLSFNLKRVNELIDDKNLLAVTVWHELEHVYDAGKKHAMVESLRHLQDAYKYLANSWYRAEDERTTTQRTTLRDKYVTQ
jgi:hypothetical protein